MLRPLALSGLSVVLLPCEARSFPVVKHIFHEVFAKISIQFRRLGFVWARNLCYVLYFKLALRAK